MNRITNKIQNEKTNTPLFRKVNYILMGIGLALLAVGYLLLVGGGAEDPSEFNPAIYNARRMNVAPVLIVAGLLIEIVAIMYYPKMKKEDNVA